MPEQSDGASRTAPALRVSYAIAASIVAAWVAVALGSELPIWAAQPSHLLLAFGAVDGSVFQTHEWWRLISAQWLHVRGPHMLFNAAVTALAGAHLEAGAGWARVLVLYLSGGVFAMFVSVLAYPNLVSSGASQAMLALCGAALVQPLLVRRATAIWWFIAAAALTQFGLDVFGSTAHSIKAGHAAGFAVGAMWGLVGKHRLG